MFAHNNKTPFLHSTAFKGKYEKLLKLVSSCHIIHESAWEKTKEMETTTIVYLWQIHESPWEKLHLETKHHFYFWNGEGPLITPFNKAIWQKHGAKNLINTDLIYSTPINPLSVRLSVRLSGRQSNFWARRP